MKFIDSKVSWLKENRLSQNESWKKITVTPNHFAPVVAIPGDHREEVWSCNQFRNIANSALNSVSVYVWT